MPGPQQPSASGVGFFVDRELSPAHLVEVAHAAEEAGYDSIWVIEDCFWGGGMTAAATVLATTSRVRVGLGIAPAPLRNPALLAMETSVLASAHPGRFVLGIGHGVQSWMGQAGAQVDSPMTLLRETTLAVAALLRGEQVSTDGRYVHLDRVRLVHAPEQVPPIVLGVQGPNGLALAGEIADGVILVEGTGPGGVTTALETMGTTTAPQVIVFANCEPDPTAAIEEGAEVPAGTITGALAERRAAIDALVAAGATEVVLRPVRALGDPARLLA
jgi:alkanesulfonate monooxygenase SsuD/methylene tetrahydromethanopterin reductase-like flavin-dependent oxidoreductase (luciferase family)